MSEKTNEGSDAGCFLIIGIVIVGIAIGNIYTPVHGWLVVGMGFIAAALISGFSR